MNGRPNRRGLLLLLAKVLLSGVLLAILIQRMPTGQVSAALRAASPTWLLAAGGLLFFSNVLGSYQWTRLMQAVDIKIPFWKVLAFYHVGLFFNNFLPANVGGDIARVVDASRYASTRTAAIATVLLDRMIGTVSLAGLALVTTLPALASFHLTVLYLALVGFFVLSVTVVWAVFHPRARLAMGAVLDRLGLGRLRPALDELSARLVHYRGQRPLMLQLLAIALVTQLSRVGVHVLVGRALGLDVPTPYFFLFVPLLAVIVSLPISLNGIGVREGAGVLLFGLVGVERAQAFSLQFTTYLVSVAVSLLGGVVFLARMPHRRAEARQAGRTSG
jgi:uncharacterized protein (TIRG00374 family)